MGGFDQSPYLQARFREALGNREIQLVTLDEATSVQLYSLQSIPGSVIQQKESNLRSRPLVVQAIGKSNCTSLYHRRTYTEILTQTIHFTKHAEIWCGPPRKALEFY